MTAYDGTVDHVKIGTLLQPILEQNDAEAMFDQFDRLIRSEGADRSTREFRDFVFACLIKFLNHDDYQVAANTARIVRNYPSVYEPRHLDKVVKSLTTLLGQRSITAAMESATTLGFLLSTRPRATRLPSWDGTDPLTQNQGLSDFDQSRFVIAPDGPGRIDDVQDSYVTDAIVALIANLDRADYKRSADWVVGEACAVALGCVGYTRPQIVANAVPAIKDAASNNDVNHAALIYAFTSIGYTQPSLLDADIITWVNDLAEKNSRTSLPLGVWETAHVGQRKIGHAPTWLGVLGTYPGPDLAPLIDKLCHFLLGNYLGFNDEVVTAFRDIVATRPTDAIPLLEAELDTILNGNVRNFRFPSNFMCLLKELSDTHPDELTPLASRATQIYQTRSRREYWYNCAADLLINIHRVDPNAIPSSLSSALTNILNDSGRSSIHHNTDQLLTTIQ